MLFFVGYSYMGTMSLLQAPLRRRYETQHLHCFFQRHRLLGAHAIGTGATELIHVGQAVMGLGGGLDYFVKTVFNYPTLAECYKVAALDAHNKLQN